ncbi:hypothetical protein UFOVP586_52 [uncultured Caudovirales phage]|uniref:Uncharacterized protein n=1 Tax=uncultured Caudovirales phage TaxID=2100421 RepID=A0A6J5MXZ8_9CAUD|nr:hypothetical protein UFOVP586_52 [uncultured Caudovirales phage]
MTDREAMKMALGAIKAAHRSHIEFNYRPNQNYMLEIIGKLEAALAQPEQDHRFETLKKLAGEALTALEKYNRYEIKTDSYDHSTKLIYDLRDVLNHKRMPLRKWVGLTDDEIALYSNWLSKNVIKAIETNLKEKNT